MRTSESPNWARMRSALGLAALLSLATTSLPANVAPSSTLAVPPMANVLPCGSSAAQTQLSQHDLLEMLRPAVGDAGGVRARSWFEDSVRRRVCHACVASGRGEREGAASYGIASDCGDLRWRALLCKNCVGGSRPVPPHLLPLARRCRRCRRFATFGPPDGNRSSASHCKEHKEPHEVVVAIPKCEHPDCARRALFGQATSLVARACAARQASVQPTPVSHSKCQQPPHRHASVRRLALRCGFHRQPGDIEVYSRFCEVAGCRRHATCGPTDPTPRRSVCAMHKPAPDNNATAASFADLSSVVCPPHALPLPSGR